MKKYRATFTVTKTFESEVFFEAPDDEVAAEMASDMEQDEDENISDRADDDSVSVDEVSLDGNPKETNSPVKVDRSIQRWCDQWMKEREED